MPNLWLASNYTQLLQETWGDETFVFNPASGHTHILNTAASELLSILAKQASSTEDLINAFSDDEGNLDAALSKALEEQIAQLHTMGLIKESS